MKRKIAVRDGSLAHPDRRRVIVAFVTVGAPLERDARQQRDGAGRGGPECVSGIQNPTH
jgi:hypothetical protein